MARNSLLIGGVAKRSGASRKALRRYEAVGILAGPRRTPAGYRVYSSDTLALLSFVRRAQRLSLTLGEIKEIVAIRRTGRVPCPHVCDLVHQKAEGLDERLADLMQVRNSLRLAQQSGD